MVRYTLAGSHMGPGSRTGTTVARMLVQMLDDQRIRMEMFSASEAADTFTISAGVFVR
jgi:hypothetical protein